MDQFDQAQEFEERDRQAALARHARLRRTGPSMEVCIDCGEKIPEARRIAIVGCERCVGCEHEHERTGGPRE